MSQKLFFIILFAFLAVGCGARVDGSNWPGMTADNDTVYIAYGPEILAYDVANQDFLWQWSPEGNVMLFASPNIENGRLVIGDYGATQGFLSPGVSASVYALEDLESRAPTPLNWGEGEVARDRLVASPLQTDGFVFVGTADNQLVALSSTNGTEQWRTELGHSVWGQPQRAGDLVIVTSLDRSVRAYDVSSGSEIWRTDLSGAIQASPLVIDNIVYVSSFDGAVHALNTSDGSEIWQASAENWIWNAPAEADGILYFGDSVGNVYAVNADDGSPVWQTTVDGSIQGGIVIEDDTLFIPTILETEGSTALRGEIVALRASDGTSVWRETTNGALYTTPVIVNGQLAIVYADDNEPLVLEIYDLDGRSADTARSADIPR